MVSGDVLSQWLQRQHGSVVQGPLVSLSRGGLLRVSDVPSRPVRVVLPVAHGGQAAVVRAVDQAGTSVALRVQVVSSDSEKVRQMERLVSMTTVAQAARAQPDRFPAALPVLESFVLVVPGTDLSVTAPEPDYELWCDLMAWCPHDLNGWAQAVPVADRQAGAVLGAFVPVLATVHAVHQDLGIVHRDITPNNVLVDERGRLLLADWGIAHGLAADQTSTYTQLVGNRGFSLPPEMLAGDPSVGRYTDAWYLGSLLAWMLTGQTPGPQHGEGWLPPGLPGGPVGEQVAAVVRGLCWPDPRGRTDLGQALTLLTDAAAGRVSADLAALVGRGAGGPGAGGSGAVGSGTVGTGTGTVGTGVTTPDLALPPTARYTGGQAGSQAFGPTSPQPYPGPPAGPAPEPGPDRSSARTWRRTAVAVAGVVIVAVALWAVLSRPWSKDTPPAAAPTGQTSTGPAPSDGSAGPGGQAGPADSPGSAPTGPTYSADRIDQVLADLYDATGGTQFAQIVFYPDYVYATAVTTPGAATFDAFTWRDGEVTHQPSPVQPKPSDLFDASTVDWTLAERLVAQMPDLTGVDDPARTYVSVSLLGSGGAPQFMVMTMSDYYQPWVLADAAGNVTQMGGGAPGSPAADP